MDWLGSIPRVTFLQILVKSVEGLRAEQLDTEPGDFIS